MRSTLVAGCLAVMCVSGCYLSHRATDPSPIDGGRDAAIRRDSGRRDAGPIPRPDTGVRPSGTYWTLEPSTAFLAIPHTLGCTQYEGGRVAISAQIPISTRCEHAGPVTATYGGDGVLIVSSFVWLEHPLDPSDCEPFVAAIEERVVLVPAQEGTLTAQDAMGGTQVVLDVGVIDDRPCTRDGIAGTGCLMDCDCRTGLVCVPHVGDFSACEGGECGVPCNRTGSAAAGSVYAAHLDCEPSEQCRNGGGVFYCAPIDVEGCDPAASDCGPGLTCPMGAEDSECIWQLRLSGMNRVPCMSDTDCETGLYCVQHADGIRQCDVPCFTQDMHCPFMHECDPGRWICEWIGE